MTRTASLETSKRLFELSGWGDPGVRVLYDLGGTKQYFGVPAYNSDYLLGMLPPIVTRKNGGREKHWYLELAIMQDTDTNKSNGWEASYQSIQNSEGLLVVKGADMITFADTPAEALALLAIKLFEEGVLK